MPIRVDRTQEIEKALTSVYLKLFSDIKQKEQYPNDITFLKTQYNRKVYDASRQAITQVFAQGHAYVARELGVETFQSDSDTQLIKQETEKAVNTFWTRLEADADRERQIQQESNRLVVDEKPSDPFDTDFYLQNAAMIATTGALAISTLTKTEQVVSDPELNVESKPKIRWVAQQDERTCLRLPNGGEGCAFLDNQIWDYDDVDIPVPGRLGPNGTHPNCRCYLSLE